MAPTSTLALVLLISSGLFLLSCGSSPAAILERAKTLQAEKRFDEAEIEFRKALQKEPDLAVASFHLAEVLWEKQKYNEAVETWRQAIQSDPNNLTYKRKLADVLLSIHLVLDSRESTTITEADRLIQEIAQADPSDPETLRLQGALASIARDWEAAEKAFRQAADQNKGQSPERSRELLLGLAKSAFMQKRAAEARKMVSDELAKNSNWPAAYDLLYSFALLENNPQEALAQLQAKKQATRQPAVDLQLARFHLSQNQPSQALEMLKNFPPDATPQLLLEAASLAEDIDAWPEARKLYERAAAGKQLPGFPAQLRLISGLARRGMAKEALDFAEAQLKTHSDSVEIQSAKASILSLSADPKARQDAIATFRTLIEKNPQNAPVRYNFAVALRSNGDPNGATEQLKEALKLDSAYALAMIQQGEIQLEQGNAAAAQRLAEDALRVEPNSGRAVMLRLNALAAGGRLGEARLQLNTLLRDQPDNFELRNFDGLLAVAERRFPEAEKRFRSLYSPESTDLRPLTGLVSALLGRGKATEALAEVQRARKSAPGSPILKFMEARVSIDAKQFAAAEPALRELISQEPKNLPYRAELGRLFAVQGKWSEAVIVMKEALAQDESNPSIRLTLADYQAMAKQTAEAEANYRKVLAAQPNSYGANNNLASLLADENRSLEEAERLARKALELSPNSPEAQDTLAWVRWKLHRDPESKTTIAGLVRRYPQNAIFREHLAELTKP